jgi:hypothetical protein
MHRSNDLLLLDEMSFSKPASLPPTKASARLTINKRGELVAEKVAEAETVEEDAIDRALAKEDGWIAPQSDPNQKTMKIDDLGIAVHYCSIPFHFHCLSLRCLDELYCLYWIYFVLPVVLTSSRGTS